MKFLIVGGDIRAVYAMEALRARGHEVRGIGLSEGDEALDDVCWAEVLVFPYPYSVRDSRVPTYTGLTLYPRDILSHAHPNALILSGDGLGDALAAARSVGMHYASVSYAQNEDFLNNNAELSAEGALYEAMRATNLALMDAVVMVTGYGRFGRALARRLRALGAEVWIAARGEKQRLQAVNDDMCAIVPGEIKQIAPRLNLLLNTAPGRMLTDEVYAALPKSCVLYELAGAPYGLSREAAIDSGHVYELLPRLPARYAPLSAGRALAKACEHFARAHAHGLLSDTGYAAGEEARS